MQRVDRPARDRDNIIPPVRFRAVRSPAAYHAVEHVGGCAESASVHPDLSCGKRRVAVQRKRRPDVRSLKKAVGKHRQRAPGRLLGRLKNQQHIAGKLFPHLVKQCSGAQKTRRVYIVPARVHGALVFRTPRNVRFLPQRQRVHIRPQQHGAGARLAFHQPRNAGTGNAPPWDS